MGSLGTNQKKGTTHGKNRGKTFAATSAKLSYPDVFYPILPDKVDIPVYWLLKSGIPIICPVLAVLCPNNPR